MICIGMDAEKIYCGLYFGEDLLLKNYPRTTKPEAEIYVKKRRSNLRCRLPVRLRFWRRVNGCAGRFKVSPESRRSPGFLAGIHSTSLPLSPLWLAPSVP